jgi:tetratricopeptide (TPR) repeat protein
MSNSPLVFELLQKPVGTLDLLLYLYRHGRTRVTVIVSETGMNRETFYSASDRLQYLGFAYEQPETGFPVHVYLGLTRDGEAIARDLLPLEQHLSTSERSLEEELARLEREDSPPTVSRRMEILEVLADREFSVERWEAAQEQANRLVALAGAGRVRRAEVIGRLALGRVFQKQDRHDEAIRELQAALRAASESGEEGLAADVEYLLGSDLERRGSWADAISQFRASADRATRVADPVRAARARQGVGRVEARRGNLQESLAMLRDNVRELEHLHAEEDLPRAYANLGSTTYSLHLPEAVEWFEKAADAARRNGEPRMQAFGLSYAAAHWIDQGQFRKAETYLNRAREIFGKLEDHSGRGSVELNTAYLYSSQNRWSDAEAQFERALAIARESGNRFQEASAFFMEAQMMKRRERRAEARSLYGEARRIFADLGSASRVARCDEELGDLS